MLPASPRVVLIPGLGMWTAGKTLQAARVPGDIYRHTIGILGDAEAVAQYQTLQESDAFSAEYWDLELYKLTLAPPDSLMAKRIVLITGAARGIGRAIAERFASEGAHVAVCDLKQEECDAVANAINTQYGSSRAVGIAMDVTSEVSVKRAFEEVVLQFGEIGRAHV